MGSPSSRFALLRHELPAGHPRAAHWDLLLEHEGVAWTWELSELPLAWSQQGVAGALKVIRLPDHRLDYLEYEGPISEDRGWVTRIAWGTCQWQDLARGSLRAQLTCSEWSAKVRLLDMQAHDHWQLEVSRARL